MTVDQPSERDKALTDCAEMLERILRAQLDGHRQLLEHIERKREAIRRADINAVGDLCQQEHAVAHHVTELEKHRLALVGKLTGALRPNASEPLKISEIAEIIGGEHRESLLEAAMSLCGAVDEVRRASSIVRAAGESLSRHMSGLMQTVQSALSRARVYGERGKLRDGEQCQFCVDLTS